MYDTSWLSLTNIAKITAKIALALATLLAICLTPFSSAMAERVGLVTEVQSTVYGQPLGGLKALKANQVFFFLGRRLQDGTPKLRKHPVDHR